MKECQKELERELTGHPTEGRFPSFVCKWNSENRETVEQITLIKHNVKYDPFSGMLMDSHFDGINCGGKARRIKGSKSIWIQIGKFEPECKKRTNCTVTVKIGYNIDLINGQNAYFSSSVLEGGNLTNVCKINYCGNTFQYHFCKS